jgi:hypothetical protein
MDLFIANFRVEALRAEVLTLKAKLQSAKSSLRRERAPRKNSIQTIRRPKNMSDATYASGLADAVIHLLGSIRTKKRRKETSSTFLTD